MICHERLRPPSRDYPADEWNVVEKAFHPEFLAQLETMLAVGNGYLGMRGSSAGRHFLLGTGTLSVLSHYRDAPAIKVADFLTSTGPRALTPGEA